MADLDVQCPCGQVTMTLSGDPFGQSYCHCDDCQKAHGAAYVPRAVYPVEAVKVKSGETRAWVYKTNRRTNCVHCGSFLFANAQGFPFTGINGALLPPGMFRPQMHLQCQHAVAPVKDSLPHFKDWPKEFGGSGELVGW